MKKKTVLFYAPGIEPFWVKNVMLQPLHALAEEGWDVYFYVSNRYGAWDIVARDYLPSNPQTKIHLIQAVRDFPADIDQRFYSAGQTFAIKGFLEEELKGIQPDVIIVRGPSAPYLAAVFPAVRIFNLREGHFPFLNFGHEVVLSLGEPLYGFPFYDQHRQTLLKRHRVTSADSAKIDQIRKAVDKKLYSAVLEDYIDKLRKRFSRLILFPFEYFGGAVDFCPKYHTVAGSQVENLRLLIKNSPSDWGFLATFHPLSLRPDIFTPCPQSYLEALDSLAKPFAEYQNVFFPQFELFQILLTHSLVKYTDATAIQTGKTFFLTMLLDKPLIRFGAIAVDFYKPIEANEDFGSAVEKFTPPSRHLMNHFFHWVITCFKQPAPPEIGAHYYIRSMLERSVDKSIPDLGLYEWAGQKLRRDSLDAMVKQVLQAPVRLY